MTADGRNAKQPPGNYKPRGKYWAYLPDQLVQDFFDQLYYYSTVAILENILVFVVPHFLGNSLAGFSESQFYGNRLAKVDGRSYQEVVCTHINQSI